MFTIRIGGIEVTCEGAADAAALIAALGERGATRLLPDAAAERAADTGSGPPSPAAAPAPFVARGGPPPRVPQRAPRARTWSDEDLRALHARFLDGTRMDDLAAERQRTGHRLYQEFKRLGLATARPSPVAAQPPAPPKPRAVLSRVNREKQDWTAAPGHQCAYVDGRCLGCDRPRVELAPERKAG